MIFRNLKRNIKLYIVVGIIIFSLVEMVAVGYLCQKIKKLKYVIEHRESLDKKGVIDEKGDNSSKHLNDVLRKLK